MKHYVYWHIGADGEILYVGRTNDVISRTMTHSRLAKWFDDVVEVRTFECSSGCKARIQESHDIRNLRPKYNRVSTVLPTDAEVESMNLEWKPHKFYDSIISMLGLRDDEMLAKIIGVSIGHIKLVRNEYRKVFGAEVERIARAIGAPMFVVTGNLKQMVNAANLNAENSAYQLKRIERRKGK